VHTTLIEILEMRRMTQRIKNRKGLRLFSLTSQLKHTI